MKTLKQLLEKRGYKLSKSAKFNETWMVQAIIEWLEQKRREIGDNDEWRAIDLIKDLLEELKQ